MKTSVYKSYDELPLFLNAETVAKVLGIAPSSAYELLHEADFPVLKVGNRMVVPKEKFVEWVQRHITENIPFPRASAHICHAGHPAGGGRQDSLQHPGALQRGLHPGRLHPRHRGDAKGRNPKDGQPHGPASGIKNSEKE